MNAHCGGSDLAIYAATKGAMATPTRTAAHAQMAGRAAAFGIARACATLEELLNDPAVQVVHVTAPDVAHYPRVMQILAAGRHVICEKPLAMTSAQSAEMRRAARASGKIAAVCYNRQVGWPGPGVEWCAPAAGSGGAAEWWPAGTALGGWQRKAAAEGFEPSGGKGIGRRVEDRPADCPAQRCDADARKPAGHGRQDG